MSITTDAAHERLTHGLRALKHAVQADEPLDVIVVGAGLSGVAAGVRLQELCPGKSWAILEARSVIGGTWDLFRYPGVRSDSDMYSLGYAFRPWSRREAIGEGADILQYIRDTAAEYGVDRRIRFGHRVVAAQWSSATSLWTVTARREDDGELVTLTCRFLHWCSGYYRYDAGCSPQFAGRERFTGTIVHPQDWDETIDYTGKRVVVIGSGATAVTVVPVIARTAASVTMLQRSPTYIVSYPAVDPLAKPLLALLPDRVAHAILRWKNVAFTAGSWELSRRWPHAMKRLLVWQARVQLPRGYDVKRHFTPSYNPWSQRICLAPNGDFFRAIRQRRVTVVTDHVETFTETGIRLRSGQELDADLIVTATGITMQPFGGASLAVDGTPVSLPERTAYKGMMLDSVPNLAFAMGYTNASFTLKCDLTHRYVCRLINHMDAHGQTVCAPDPPSDAIERLPAIDMISGYVQRSILDFQRQGSQVPWRLYQNYPRDIRALLHHPLEDDVLRFSTARCSAPSKPSGALETAA